MLGTPPIAGCTSIGSLLHSGLPIYLMEVKFRKFRNLHWTFLSNTHPFLCLPTVITFFFISPVAGSYVQNPL